jgi:DNA-binding MarR family transcriptional regulator
MQDADRTALDVWRTVTARTIATPGPDLTARQSAILLTVHLDAGPHTVRGLAGHLGIGKPAVVRALDTLQQASLIARATDPNDRRSVLISPTDQGAALLADLASTMAAALASATIPPRPPASDGRAAA